MALQQHTAQLTEKYEQLSVTYEQLTAHLTKKYKQLSTNYKQLRQMIMNMASHSGDTCAPYFWPYNNQPPPPPPPPLSLC